MSVLALRIAGVRVDLAVPGAVPQGLDRYRPFSGAAGAARWTLELLSHPARLTPSPGRAVVERGGRWVVAAAEEAGAIDPVARTGAVRADDGLLLLDAFVRAAVGTEVLDAGGLLLHAAAVVVDGAAHLFPARSGSGKSTLASRASHPLSDEVSVLAPGAGGFRAHATPWWLSRGGDAPLAGLYAVAWGGEGTAPLPRTAVRQLVTNLVLPVDTPANRVRALAAAARVADGFPFARFAFRLDSDVDRLLRSALRTEG